METSTKVSDYKMENPKPAYTSATFESMKDLLQAKDDTSRFVGLALLKSVLDNGELAQDPERLRTLWEALSPKFLDRLLRAQRNEKINKAEAQSMVDLAAAILHTFTVLLPDASRQEKRLTGRTEPLVKALLESPPETTNLILQTLLTIVSQPEGALQLWSIEDMSPLTEIATQYSLVLDILGSSWTNAATVPTEVDKIRKSINGMIPTLQNMFKGTDAVTFISFIAGFLPQLVPEALPQDPTWLKPLISSLRKLVTSRPTLVGRAAYTQLAAALLQVYPATCPSLLFKDSALGNADDKPFSYLFINLLLIDIHSSFPTLLSKLNSVEYPAISQRLAAAFDVISSFIGFLVRTLDDESGFTTFSMPSDLLLKLRKDIAETISLTIEYLRDRWDASVAGASGLHPSARTGTAATSEGTRLTLTWDSMKDDVTADPLILAGIRALAIWIREDENENLRNESAGIMDMLVELYKTGTPEKLDFRYPILLALEGIMTTEDGVESFLGQEGWKVVVQDLERILRNVSSDSSSSVPSNNAARGLEIVRVLLAVIDSPSTSTLQEEWMGVVTTAASMKLESTATSIIVEFQISMVQLATALLSKAAGGMQKRYITSNAGLSGLTNQLGAIVKRLDDKVEAAEFLGLLEDVSLDLENLGFNGS